jgi:hypothetical protein
VADPVALDERLRLRRWLAAVGLTTAAEDAARVDTPETNAIALLGAYSACETLLGLLAGVRRYKQGDEVSFPRLLTEAGAKVTIEADLGDDLDAMHRIRNAFVHASNTVAADETARAISNARRLMELVPFTVPAAANLSASGGLGSAVAAIVDVPAVGMWLRHADAMLAEGRVQLAADGLARALRSTLARTRPRLLPLPDPGRTQRQLLRMVAAPGDNEMEIVTSEIEGLQEWVLPLALGLSPAAYDDLVGVIGKALPNLGGGPPVHVRRPRDVLIDDRRVRQAVSRTAEVIFRLWAMGSLRPSPVDEREVEQARSYLENPTDLGIPG